MKKILWVLAFVLCVMGCQEENTEPLPSPGNVIKSFKLPIGQLGKESVIIRSDYAGVVVKVLSSVDLTHITPVIKISDKATIVPASGEAVDISTNNIVEYKITSESGQVRTWEVKFEIVNDTEVQYGAYIITDQFSTKGLNVAGDILNNEKYWDDAFINVEAVDLRRLESVKQYKKWHIIYEKSVDNINYFKIRNLFTGKYLTAPSDKSNILAAQVKQIGYQPEKENDDLKLWELESLDGGVTYRIINKKNGFVLSRDTENQNDGSNKVLQVSKEESENQLWKLFRIDNESYRDDQVINFFERNERQMGSVAFDQGNSIPLTWGANAGKVLWVTQDAWDGQSLRDHNGDGITDKFLCSNFFSYNNSILIQPSKDDWNPLHTFNMENPANISKPRQISPNVPGTNRTWIGAGVEIENKVYLHAGEGNGLTHAQNSLRVLTQSEGTQWQEERIQSGEMPGGSGLVKGGDDYVYSYSTRSTYGYDSKVYVSRFHKNDPRTWTHWNGTTWSSTIPANGNGIVGNAYGSTGVSVYNGTYILMTMQQGFNCDNDRGKVYLSKATSPTGPFSEPKLVYQITDYLKSKYTRYYTPIVHPHADNGRQELLLTYSVNFGACGQDECENGFLNPYYYRVKAIRVPFEMIGL